MMLASYKVLRMRACSTKAITMAEAAVRPSRIDDMVPERWARQLTSETARCVELAYSQKHRFVDGDRLRRGAFTNSVLHKWWRRTRPYITMRFRKNSSGAARIGLECGGFMNEGMGFDSKGSRSVASVGIC